MKQPNWDCVDDYTHNYCNKFSKTIIQIIDTNGGFSHFLLQLCATFCLDQF